MFKKILIANRGEIACRIIKTARRLNIKTVAVYSAIDKDQNHVLEADEAYEIGPGEASLSYLNIENIIKVAIASKAQAIHPGYGFLSENSLFAKACQTAKIVFIGPSIDSLEKMSSKQTSKQILEKTNVPLIPGFHGKEQSEEKLLDEAKKIGFPVLLKAALGGGGKGMRIVENEDNFHYILEGAKREAKSYFKDDTIIIEKYLSNPRHIEIQIMADNYGNVVHLFERDCSIQRRHQKIIEQAPGSSLSTKLRNNLYEAAIRIAKKIDYRGAGTIEFLVDGENFYFMEMNTRLQVEHPATEMITNLDLVEWQLKIAANEKLPLEQNAITATGCAIECRVYAEDPLNNFMPSTGVVNFLQEPDGENIRIDSSIILNSKISVYYDPLIAKLIAWGSNRDEAIKKLLQALKKYHIGGVKNNIQFLKAILANKDFIHDKVDTNFLTTHTLDLPVFKIESALLLAACMDYISSIPKENSIYRDAFAWQLNLSSKWQNHYIINNEKFSLLITPVDKNSLKININNKKYHCNADIVDNYLTINTNNRKISAYVLEQQGDFEFYAEDGSIEVKKFNWDDLVNKKVDHNRELSSPMPATIIAIHKNKGDKVQKGEVVIVLEAMKMEHIIYAPADGILVEIFYNIGEQVKEGALLGEMEKAEHAKAS